MPDDTSRRRAQPVPIQSRRRSSLDAPTSFVGSLNSIQAVGSLRGHTVFHIPAPSLQDELSSSAPADPVLLRASADVDDELVLPEQKLPELDNADVLSNVPSNAAIITYGDGSASMDALQEISEPNTSASQPLLPAEANVGSEASGSEENKASTQELLDAFIIGMINVIVNVPSTLAYINIMFPNPKFRPYIGTLAKLVFFGSALHQLTFSLRSALPFAVGQVQDVGLIFLSAISTSVVVSLEAMGEGKNNSLLMTTTLLAMTLSTTIVGLLLIAVGKRKLASLISYIPLPVVAGYLGYVGYFCLAAGASQISGSHIASIPSWLVLFKGDVIVKTIVGMGSFAFIYFTLRFWDHPLSMPVVLLAVPTTYYVVLCSIYFTSDMSWHELFKTLDHQNWITMPEGRGDEKFWEVYELYDLFPWRSDNVAWLVLLKQLPITLALFFVVMFGSCLDITAIQANLSYEVDFNEELVTVGVSNLLTGVCGAGFTGSYIFSQTLFTQRTGCEHRLNGAVVVVVELALFLVPMSFMEYLPNFYYGALLLVFGLEISLDWLVYSWARFTLTEFVLTWAVYVLIMVCTVYFPVSGLEIGIGVGIIVCAMHFAVEYSRVQVSNIKAVSSVSACVRPFFQREVLEIFQNHIEVVGLQGYVFFGSAVVLGDRIKATTAGINACVNTLLEDKEALAYNTDVLMANVQTSDSPDVRGAIAGARKFVLLDFQNVAGLDATAAAQLKTIATAVSTAGLTLVLTGIAPGSAKHKLMKGNGVIAVDGDWERARLSPCFASTDDALSWCEEHFIQIAVDHGLLRSQFETLTLHQVLTMHLHGMRADDSASQLVPDMDLGKASEGLQRYTRRLVMIAGTKLFDIGDKPDAFYIVLSGEVTCVVDLDALKQTRASLPDPSEEVNVRLPSAKRSVQYLRYAAGGVTGDLEFFLQQPRSFEATVTKEGEALCIERSDYIKVLKEKPALAALLQHVILRNEMLSSRNQMALLHRLQAAA